MGTASSSFDRRTTFQSVQCEVGSSDITDSDSKNVHHGVSDDEARVLRECERDCLMRGSIPGIAVGTALAYSIQSGDKKSLVKFLIFGIGGYIAGQIMYTSKCTNRIALYRARKEQGS